MRSDMHLMRQVLIFDTTLRDGEQAPGYSLDVEQKVELALQLERLGVNTIEAGFPISSPVDMIATREICRTLRKAKTCGFARTLRADIDACADAMADAANPMVQVASVGSDIHMRHKRQVTPEQVEKETLDALDHARTVGFTDISLAFEDATRGDVPFMKRLISEGLERGITAIAIPDTVGCCLPQQFHDLIAELRALVGDGIRISIHCHDDLGLAVANSVAGIQGGADEVQTTLCGIGERAGNCALEELVAILNSKQAELHCVHDVVTHRLFDACSTLAGMIGLQVPRHKAILGTNAFSTEAGMHQQGVLRHRFTYEWLRAEDYGATPRVAMGRHSGRTIVRHRLASRGVTGLDERAVDAVYEAISHAETPEQFESAEVLVAAYRRAVDDLARMAPAPAEGDAEAADASVEASAEVPA